MSERDVWRRHVVAEIAPLLAGRDLRAGGSLEVACQEIADALFPQIESCGRDVASAYRAGLADARRQIAETSTPRLTTPPGVTL